MTAIVVSLGKSPCSTVQDSTPWNQSRKYRRSARFMMMLWWEEDSPLSLGGKSVGWVELVPLVVEVLGVLGARHTLNSLRQQLSLHFPVAWHNSNSSSSRRTELTVQRSLIRLTLIHRSATAMTENWKKTSTRRQREQLRLNPFRPPRTIISDRVTLPISLSSNTSFTITS